MKAIHYPHSTTTVAEAKAMESRYDKIQIKQVQAAFASSGLGLTVKSVRQPESYGTRHVIYIVAVKEHDEEFIFRSNIGYSDTPEQVLVHEKLMTDKARAAGVPVNEVLYVDISRAKVDFDFQIQKVVAGLDLEDHFHGTEADYKVLSEQIGELTAKLHTVQLEGFGRFDTRSTDDELVGDVDTNEAYVFLDMADELSDLASAELLTDARAAAVEQYFKDRKELMHLEKGSLLHYDIADHNIMFDGDRITGLIDWEAAVSSDPVLDIASMPTWATHYDRLDDFLVGYKRVGTLPEGFDEKMKLYKLRTILWKTSFNIKADILNEARTKRFYDCLKEVGIN